MENIEKEFNSLQSFFNDGKKYLVGKSKNIKLALESYEIYYTKLNNIYENLKSKLKEEITKINQIYISNLTRLSKIYLLIPYYYKAKILCEKILEIDKNNIQIIPTYIKCLHHFKQYSLITSILDNIKNEDEIIKDLKVKNEERIKQSKGIYNLKEIYDQFKKNYDFNLDIAEYISNKISIKQDKIKGLIIVANEDIPKGEILITEKAIEFVALIDRNFKYNISKEIWHDIIKNKIKDKMMYCKEDNPELFEIYNGANTNLSLQERKDNYIKNISKNNNIIMSQKEIDTLFSDSFCTKLYYYDEFSIVSGLFYYSSFLSHSCDPNSHMLGLGNFIFAIADKNIKANEEITTFYVENDQEFLSRQKKLLLNYGFKCQCPLCQIEQTSLEQNKEVKNKVSKYILQMIDMSVYMFNYNIMEYFLKHEEVNKFIEQHKDKIKNFEKGLLYYNLYYLWSSFETNYNLLEKALYYFEKEESINFNTMIYYCLLKMYKMNYIYNNELCGEIKEKMIKLLKEAFGNKQNEFVETIVEDIIKINTSDEDPDINLFKEKLFDSLF